MCIIGCSGTGLGVRKFGARHQVGCECTVSTLPWQTSWLVPHCRCCVTERSWEPTLVSVLIAIGCIIIFGAGIWCYGLAFQVDGDTLRLLVFLAGILLNSLALFIPWQLVGQSRK